MVLDLLTPQDYKKYINLFLGLCITLTLLSPVIDISKNFKNDLTKEILSFSKKFDNKNSIDSHSYAKNIINELKKRIVEDIKVKVKNKYGKDIVIEDIEINEDIKSNQFGKIISITINQKFSKELVEYLSTEYLIESKSIFFKEVKKNE